MKLMFSNTQNHGEAAENTELEVRFSGMLQCHIVYLSLDLTCSFGFVTVVNKSLY